MSKTFSLCLTTQNINDKDKTILFRLADKVGNELKEPDYSGSRDCTFNDSFEDTGYKFPYTSFANHTIGELRIWEWDPQIAEWAKKTSILFYELINDANIVSLSEKAIIQMLKKGYEIYSYHGQKSLLVVEEREDTYKVVELDSSIVSTIKGITKLNKNITKINTYILNKQDFFTTDRVKVLSIEGEELSPRIIYKHLEINAPNVPIEVLSFDEKMKLFINKQIKVYELSKSHQKDIKNLFSEILCDYDDIHKFFIENGFNTDGLVGKINIKAHEINKVLSDNSLWDKFSKAIIENIPELREKYYKLIESQFLKENQSLINDVDLKLLDKKNELTKISEECVSYKKSLTILEEKKNTYEQEVGQLENTQVNLKKALTEKVSAIKNDMAGFISEMTLLDIMGGSKPIGNIKNYTVKLSENTKEKVDCLYEITEFLDVLTFNLGIAGIEEESRRAASNYILASIIQKTSIFLTGKFTSNIANAISTAFCGKTADIIAILSSDVELEQITEEIKNCTSKVVLIENIANLNEIKFIQLLKVNTEKIVIYANDIIETLNFIPNSLLCRLNLLCLDFICEKQLNEPFMYANARNINFESKYHNFTYRAAKEELEKLIGKCIYSNLHCAIKSELIAIVEDVGDDNGLYYWLLCEAIPHLISTGHNEIAEEIIDTVQISEVHTKKLNKLKGIY